MFLLDYIHHLSYLDKAVTGVALEFSHFIRGPLLVTFLFLRNVHVNFDHDELARAVLFFNDSGAIVKEMNISEFEAILEGYVPLSDLAGRTVRCTYVEFDSAFHLHAAVFFKMLICATGQIDKYWHIPFLNIARIASKGPDMGAGPLRLACFSQCPNEQFRDAMWDPCLEKKGNHLVAIKHAIAKNRLGVQFRKSSVEEKPPVTVVIDKSQVEHDIAQSLRKEYAQEFRDHMTHQLNEQRLRISTLNSQQDAELDDLKQQYSKRLDVIKDDLADAKKELKETRRINNQFKSTIDGQAEKIEGLRDYYEHKLNAAQGGDADKYEALKNNFDLEVSSKVEAATSEFKELLHMREAELLYRNEQETQMREELSRLRHENQELMTSSGDQLLVKMLEKGVRLVTYQPGAGNLTLPVSELARYMENPVAYTADHCGVTEELYQAWLVHFNMPVCDAKLEDNHGAEKGRERKGVCGQNVDRIDHPSDFHLNESNRCSSHREHRGRPKLRIAGE